MGSEMCIRDRYYTGGDLTALPQRLQSLGADSLPHAGAKLI